MDYVSTSSAAFGDDLMTVIYRFVDAGQTNIQVAIGPRPMEGFLPHSIEFERLSREVGCNFTVHANAPIGDGRLLNQERDFVEILQHVRWMRAQRYTLHAPRKRDFPTWESFCVWALQKLNYTRDYMPPVEFGVETMYPATDPYWLESYDEVARFLAWCDNIGWEQPLVADIAHLQIGFNQGLWTEQQVQFVLESGQACEFHYSDNDGVHDNHRPYQPGRNPRIDRWYRWMTEEKPLAELATTCTDMVDEGRRRPERKN